MKSFPVVQKRPKVEKLILVIFYPCVVPLFVDLNYYFICKILLMHGESVYNQTVSEEGRKHDLLCVWGGSQTVPAGTVKNLRSQGPP